MLGGKVHKAWQSVRGRALTQAESPLLPDVPSFPPTWEMEWSWVQDIGGYAEHSLLPEPDIQVLLDILGSDSNLSLGAHSFLFHRDSGAETLPLRTWSWSALCGAASFPDPKAAPLHLALTHLSGLQRPAGLVQTSQARSVYPCLSPRSQGHFNCCQYVSATRMAPNACCGSLGPALPLPTVIFRNSLITITLILHWRAEGSTVMSVSLRVQVPRTWLGSQLTSVSHHQSLWAN